ncbi:HORMA domain-containing protein 1-like [Schistocerca gregaria]|uniref:HORMA domain-containing protein 1-like n=1 Tax=Schistocerca gregaria TaxID=7010 RepID=UPI00211EB533|nr:HORMA domain-containing protein 1-like [Schistocerca gregaria]
MATAIKTKTTPVVIPTTCQKSQTLIKQLVALAVSNVAYNRSFFPEDAFIEQEFEGTCVKVLNSNTKCENALIFQKWINSALEAFEKGYLKQLMVCVRPDSEDIGVVLESYKFTFNSKNDDVQMIAENSFGSSM